MEDTKKKHRVHKSGGKAKKQPKVAKHNPKAFTFSGGWRSVGRRAQRDAEIAEKREKFVRVVDKTPTDNSPPYIVVVQGPPGCGKSLLIKSLIKQISGHSVGTLNGPVTCVVSKSRRLTFVECPNDISAMIDLAKIADLAVLMIDGTHGLEMQTFEFVNIMQNHGFPKVIGVMSKLDSYKESKPLRKFKKDVKNRFWKEIFDGAKLFHLSGVKGKRYIKRDIMNLCRYISIQKYEPLVWRSQRSYLLGLNVEILSGKAEEGTRDIAVSGFVRGARLRDQQIIHVPGLGDLKIDKVEAQNDPCPLPKNVNAGSKDSNKLLRRLKQQEKVIFAPTCDIGQVEIDGGALYIKLPNNRAHFTPSNKLLDVHGDDEKDEKDEETTAASEYEGSEEGNEDSGDDGESEGGSKSEDEGLSDDEGSSGDDESEGEDDAEEKVDRDVIVSEEARDTSHKKVSKPMLVTGDTNTKEAPKKADGKKVPMSDAMKMVRELQTAEGALVNKVQNQRFLMTNKSENELMEEEAEQYMKEFDKDDELDEDEEFDINRLLIGDETIQDSLEQIRASRVAADDKPFQGNKSLLDLVYDLEEEKKADAKDEDDGSDDDDVIFTPEEQIDAVDSMRPIKDKLTHMSTWLSAASPSASTAVRHPAFKSLFCDSVLKLLKQVAFITGGWDSGPSAEHREATDLNPLDTSTVHDKFDINKWQTDRFESRKADQKRREDMRKDALQVLTQTDDIPIGTFVRITLRNIQESWIANITENGLRRPIIIGGLLAGEQNLSYLHCRVKRHRWAPGIMKTSEPLLFSVGWRRFQSLPYFALEDRNSVRLRHLKYTPEHMHCLAFFYGHAAPPGTGLLAVKHSGEKLKDFRISLTGSVLENTPQPVVLKKLKFVGRPTDIKKNTAFVTGMFNSDVEVSKVEGVVVQTQSGIRGIVKKAQGYGGDFRATFEAKINMSDIVICKAWYRIPMEPFCNPQVDVPDWDRLRTFVEVRRDLRLPALSKTDSEYGPRHQREIKKLKQFRVPKRLMQHLPYDALPAKTEAPTEAERVQADLLQKTKSAYEILAETMIRKAEAVKSAKEQHKRENLEAKIAKRQKLEELAASKKEAINKEKRKKDYATKGKALGRQRKRMRLV
eukprot:Blabericola_migrator_1__1748@NODE_1470_length_4495_cov_78_360885_g967_i0_p1_GENE_NODE_1470_length_4495_cov_78_360885_g967_i0NODE_1470_length_4495_cov_78_360885_g967_i0_p1_ORF_typecomplete_len1125_score282_66RIBIOP_C/PF04950_12/1_1e80RIBIOP_C/PF04950_12/1_5e03AARP2CN/PF08142_12/2_9e22GTP_EFTU/PF00009_27/1_8e11PduVEutP/PF10662_9/3_1e11AAA_22/PF13401_6/8_9e05AAA/PF00004_29/4_7e05MMR_HSR1/PF01926_23/0_00013AAA_16/PF13191_6/0_00014PPV_E1_C/PF00519_17/0_00041PPV_E1_C/PF00519_17/9_1e02Adeno_IVa2/PF0245